MRKREKNLPITPILVKHVPDCVNVGMDVVSIFEKIAGMCTYQTLSYNDQYGYIIYCTDCKRLQLGFGSVLINFDEMEFNSFRRIVKEIYEDFGDEPLSQRKQVTLPSPCSTISLYLSTAEISMLNDMTDEADSTLQANALVRLFE